MTPATNSDDMRKARPIAEAPEVDSSKPRPIAGGLPPTIELRFETLEPRGKIAVGSWTGAAPAPVSGVITSHGEPAAARANSVPGTPRSRAHHSFGPAGCQGNAGSV